MRTRSILLQVTACRLLGAKPLPDPMLPYCQLDPWEQLEQVKSESKYTTFHPWKCIWTYWLRNGGLFVQGRWVKLPLKVSAIFRLIRLRCSILGTLLCFQWPLWLTWLDNHMPNKVWDEITYPLPNVSGVTVEVWELSSNFIIHFIIDVITCPLKLNFVSKRGYWCFPTIPS